MKQAKPVGQQAASRKYDLLTALGVHACRGDKNLQRLVLRFVTLIVARYNWQHDELNVGQREIAQLWAVDERTVKRDMTKLKTLGWIIPKRAAARGRVAVHGLDLSKILAATQADWSAVGSDFVQRMQTEPPQPAQGNVVAFPTAKPNPTLSDTTTAWGRVMLRLQADDPALFDAWFRHLTEGQGAGEIFEIIAPSRFHASFVRAHHGAMLQTALQREGLALSGILISVSSQ